MWCAWIAVMLLLGGFQTSQAQTATTFTALDRAACYSAWMNAFYYTNSEGGRFRDQEGGDANTSFWQGAEMIEVVEDAVTAGVDTTNRVISLCNSFTNDNSMNWSWNTYNDDINWACCAFNRAYQLTKNTTYLYIAQNNWNIAFSRGWNTNGGGLYQDTGAAASFCTCGNGPCADAAFMLYTNLNGLTSTNTYYLTKAWEVYDWMVTNDYVASTGGVEEGPGNPGVYFTYDQGTFATIAFWLGDTNRAYMVGNFVTNYWGVNMQSFGPGSDGGPMNGICLRGLARTGHNIPFLQAACENAWSWQNIRGLTPTDWSERSSDTNLLYCADCMSQAAGVCCVPPGVPPTLPGTAVDVVGSQVTFSAAFGDSNPYEGLPADYYGSTFNAVLGVGNTNLDGGLSGNGYTFTNNLGAGNTYQWQFIRGGVTNNIAGATNTALTLSNLQLSNTGSYQLRAFNPLGVAVSTPASLTVNSVPAPVNNVIISFAAQTAGGYGFGLTPTWTVAPGSVIYEQIPSSTGGNFDLEPYWGNRNVNSLTMGDGLTVCPGGSPYLTTPTNYVTCGNGSGAGSLVIYTLTNTSPAGYDLTNITVYGGWKDGGRDQQAYTVYYSTVAAPETFISLGSVNYLPSNPASLGCTTRAMLTPASGVLASNVAAVEFNFTTPGSANGYCGYAEIALYGTALSPKVATNTLPVTAADVVGSQETFMAAFAAGSPLTYQWQVISGGMTNDIPGATNTTLTFTNLQLTNTAFYQLQASNAYGVAVSAPGSLTVSSVPAAVNNVITAMAVQTGTGSGTFTPTWMVTTNGSLIAGQSPSSASGNFSEEVPGRNVNSLTAGGSLGLTQIPGGYGISTSTNYVTCGNGVGINGSSAGQTIVYTLTGSASGYDLTNIMVYGGWSDASRDQQAYTVYYSTVAAATIFNLLGSVNYLPADPANAQSATRATLTPASGALATNVAAVMFDFTNPASENGYCGYAQINIYGVPTLVLATNPTNIMYHVASNNLTISWPSDHIGWQLQVQTDNLAQGLGTNWFDIVGSTTTNQWPIPVNPNDGSVFYRLASP